MAPFQAVKIAYTPRSVRHLNALSRQLAPRPLPEQRGVFAALRSAIAALAGSPSSEGGVAGSPSPDGSVAEVPVAQFPPAGRAGRRAGVRAAAARGCSHMVVYRIDDRRDEIVILAILPTAGRND